MDEQPCINVKIRKYVDVKRLKDELIDAGMRILIIHFQRELW